ncbi:MAG: hypothetical protein NC300_02040 [Bacteroidales bacterium]|nr:hypothetical protein [Clostridium sp.]MCM1202905.1 hypothetical protein [Bacteroidales bacterium]
MMQKSLKEIENLLSVFKGNYFDVCFAVYAIIADSECPPKALQFFLESCEDIESSEETEIAVIFSEEEIVNLSMEYKALTEGILNKLWGKKLDEPVFYQELWNALNSDFLFETKKAKAFALNSICRDVRIPYYKLGEGLTMTEESFMENRNTVKTELKKIRLIMASDYGQYTQQASLLLDIIGGLQDEKKKAILMAYILATLKREDSAE